MSWIFKCHCHSFNILRVTGSQKYQKNLGLNTVKPEPERISLLAILISYLAVKTALTGYPGKPAMAEISTLTLILPPRNGAVKDIPQ